MRSRRWGRILAKRLDHAYRRTCSQSAYGFNDGTDRWLLHKASASERIFNIVGHMISLRPALWLRPDVQIEMPEAEIP